MKSPQEMDWTSEPTWRGLTYTEAVTGINGNGERTGWRDWRVSAWHRKLGDPLPMIDIDFLAAEASGARAPVGIVEYKYRENYETQICTKSYQFDVLRSLCGTRLPLFAATYDRDIKHIAVTPLNERAAAFVPDFTVMSEYEYVRLLYKLRGLGIPKWIEQQLFR